MDGSIDGEMDGEIEMDRDRKQELSNGWIDKKRPDKHTDKSLDRYLQTWTDADRQTDSRTHTHTQECNAVRLRFKVQHHLGDFAGDSSMTFQRIAVSHGNSWKLGQCCDCLQVGSSLGD